MIVSILYKKKKNRGHRESCFGSISTVMCLNIGTPKELGQAWKSWK